MIFLLTVLGIAGVLCLLVTVAALLNIAGDDWEGTGGWDADC